MKYPFLLIVTLMSTVVCAMEHLADMAPHSPSNKQRRSEQREKNQRLEQQKRARQQEIRERRKGLPKSR